jgi:hypothetical protein
MEKIKLIILAATIIAAFISGGLVWPKPRTVVENIMNVYQTPVPSQTPETTKQTVVTSNQTTQAAPVVQTENQITVEVNQTKPASVVQNETVVEGNYTQPSELLNTTKPVPIPQLINLASFISIQQPTYDTPGIVSVVNEFSNNITDCSVRVWVIYSKTNATIDSLYFPLVAAGTTASLDAGSVGASVQIFDAWGDG